MNLKQIAEAANVSASTVSLVLNGKPGVSQQTRAAVTELLRQSNYNVQQQQISAGANNIRFVKFINHAKLVDGNPGFITTIMDSIEFECRKEGYGLIVTSTDKSSFPKTLDMLAAENPHGVLLLGTEMDQSDFSALSRLRCPVIIVDNPADGLPLSSITMDNRSAIYASVRHLYELGHRHIGFLKNELPASNCLNRERAFLDATSDLGLARADAPLFPVSPTTIGAWRSVQELLARGIRFPSALIANNDCIALGAIKAFKESGYQIPGDISIIGFDGIQFSDISDPPLTTTVVPCRDIGTQAVKMLCHFIDDPSAPPYKVFVTTKLILRASTAPAAGRPVSDAAE